MENKNEDLPLNQELEKSPALRMFVSHSYPCTLNREEARNHSAERFKGTLSLLKKDAFDKLILKDGHFLASCRMDEGIKKAYRELNLLLIKANVGEGDLSLAVLAYPKTKEDGIMRLAQVNFIAEPDAITVTGLQGNPSSFCHHAVNRFGKNFLEGNDLFGRLQNTLGGMKPFNALIGVLMEIAHSNGVEKIRGLEKNLINNPSYNMIKHSLHGAYYGAGMRQSGQAGVYEAEIKDRDNIERCFSRITGRDPSIKEKRGSAFDRLIGSLKQGCPFLFERDPESIRRDFRSILTRIP